MYVGTSLYFQGNSVAFGKVQPWKNLIHQQIKINMYCLSLGDFVSGVSRVALSNGWTLGIDDFIS